MKKVLLLITIGFALFACNPPTNNPDDDSTINSDVPLAEADIGSSGGIIESEGIAITVPPESLSSTVTIRIFSGEESDNVFGDNAVTALYRIEGLPEEFAIPVKVVLKYSGYLANENYLAVGNELEVLESEDPGLSLAIFEASDSAGHLVSFLEPPVPQFSSDGSVKKGTSSIFSKVLLIGLSNMLKEETPCFRLVHQFGADKSKIKKLAMYLDAAIDTFSSMGLIDKLLTEAAIKEFGKPTVTIWGRDNERYRGWRIEMSDFKVETEDIPPSYGALLWETLLKTKFSISENVLRVSTEQEIAALAFAWVYRLSCYSHVGSRQDWFIYGSTLWIQEKYSGIAEYKVTIAPEFAMSPLVGMESGKTRFTDTRNAKTVYGGSLTSQEGNYGFSMVPFLKYLDRAYAQDRNLFGRILTETILSSSKTPTEGIINAVSDPEYIWLPGFYKAYLTRELYNISFEHFKDKIPTLDQLNFYQAVDTILYNDEEYADLSARLFRVNFLMTEIKEEATLNFKLGPSSLNMDYVTAMAFGLKDGELEYFDHANDLTISNLTELLNNGYHSMVALVVNSANEAPYNEPLKIQLDTEMKIVPKEFDWVTLKVMALGNFTFSYGDEGVNEIVYTDGKLRRGTMSGSTFTASWSGPLNDGTTSGTIHITFDPEHFPDFITSFSVTETMKSSVTRKYTISGENLQFRGYKDIFGAYVYYIEGDEVKDYISYIYEEYSASDGYGFWSDGIPLTQSNSYIEIKMGTQ